MHTHTQRESFKVLINTVWDWLLWQHIHICNLVWSVYDFDEDDKLSLYELTYVTISRSIVLVMNEVVHHLHGN